jgi:phospholipid transport system substrate-binding protein
VIESIKTDPVLRSGDSDKLQRLIDDKVAPYVDFERMTRPSVGPGWRGASHADIPGSITPIGDSNPRR